MRAARRRQAKAARSRRTGRDGRWRREGRLARRRGGQRPVESEDRAQLLGQRPAARPHPKLVDLGERPPVEVLAAHVQQLAIDNQVLGVQDAAGPPKVQVADLDARSRLQALLRGDIVALHGAGQQHPHPHPAPGRRQELVEDGGHRLARLGLHIELRDLDMRAGGVKQRLPHRRRRRQLGLGQRQPLGDGLRQRELGDRCCGCGLSRRRRDCRPGACGAPRCARAGQRPYRQKDLSEGVQSPRQRPGRIFHAQSFASLCDAWERLLNHSGRRSSRRRPGRRGPCCRRLHGRWQRARARLEPAPPRAGQISK